MPAPPGRHDGDAQGRWRDRFELVATLLLALASVLTAWSAFQASKWNGIQQLSLGDANQARTEAVAELNVLTNSLGIDVGLWLSWLDARLADSTEATSFLEKAFGEPLASSFGQWLASEPFTDPDAPPTPFEEDLYFEQLLADGDLDDLLAAGDAADVATERARQANQNSDNYVLATVLVAMTLFFAGIATKFRRLRSQAVLLSVGTLALGVSVVVLVALPKVL